MGYHIRRAEREIKDVRELQSIIERGRYAVVGLSRNNEPYVVTLSYGYDKVENVLYFHCGKIGQKIDFLRSNPLACATIIDIDGKDTDTCDHPYTSVILRGAMHFVNDGKEMDRAIRLMISHLEKTRADYFYAKLQPGNKGYDNMQVLKMMIDSMTGKARQQGKGTNVHSHFRWNGFNACNVFKFTYMSM